MKIIAIEKNYNDNIEEIGNLTNENPVIFMKPDSALLKNNKPFYLPDFSNNIQYETELIIQIDRLGKNISEKFAPRYYSSIGLGIDFTARDILENNKAIGLPWEIGKAFDGSAVISEFIPISEFESLNAINFNLNINGNQVQEGNSKDMIFNINKIIAYISRFFTLKIGDIIFTGTPSGVGKVNINDHLEGYIESKKMLDFYVK